MVVGFARSTEDMIKLASLICEEITAQLPQPMALVFESQRYSAEQEAVHNA